MGTCGACTVLINGVPKASCAVLAAEANGAEITTIKGIGDILHLHPLQKAFVETGAVQCGYCTPGTILSAYALLQKIQIQLKMTLKRQLTETSADALAMFNK